MSDDTLRDRLTEIWHDEVCACGSGGHWRSSRHLLTTLMPAILADRQRAVDQAIEGVARSIEAAARPGWQDTAAHIRALKTGGAS